MVNRKNGDEKRTNPLLFGLQLGFFAGLIWGAVHGFFYFMRFTVVLPGFLAEPYFKSNFLKTQPGYYLGWLFFIVFSILAAVIYAMLFRRIKGPWPGMVYGIIWWMVIYFVMSPVLHLAPPMRLIGWNSLITEFCLFLLWGLFIGYTTALEFTDERVREPEGAFT